LKCSTYFNDRFFPPAYFMRSCFLPLFDVTEDCVWRSRELMLPITTPESWVADNWVRLDFLTGRRTPKLTQLKSRYIRTYIHTYIRTYIHAYIHIHKYIHIYIRAYIHTYMHTYTYINNYLYTYVHTYTYIHT